MRLPDLNDLIQDLQLAKQIAIEERNPNATVIATMSQAELLALDKPIKNVMPNHEVKSGLGHFYGQTDKIEVTRISVDPVADAKESY